MHLYNKVAAITGAGSGIGQALSLKLAQEGCQLALSDVNESSLNQTAEQAGKLGVTVSTRCLDVADKDSVYQWAEDVVNTHGKVNLVFNNAGVALSGTAPALSIEDYEWIMNINFWGVVYGSKAFLPYLEQSGEGHIINISSTFGLAAVPLMSGYNASKFAVRGFTEALRQDLEITSSKVSCTCVHPGGIKTNIAKTSRLSDSVESVTGASKEETLNEFERTFIHSADSAANIILSGVKKNKRRVLIGWDARIYDLLVRLFPSGYQKLFTKVVAWRSQKLS